MKKVLFTIAAAVSLTICATAATAAETKTIDADKTAQWTAQEAHLNYDLRIHGWETWENAAYIGFDLGEKLNDYDIQKAELVITTTGVNNDEKNEENHSKYPKAWLYGATYSAFENAGQYQGTDNAPEYNKDAIIEFYSPTSTGASRYDVTEYIKSQIETGNAAFRIDVKSQNSNNRWTIGSRNNGGPCPQLVIEYNEIKPAEKYEYTTDADLAESDAVGFTATFNASSQVNSLTWFLKKDGGSYKELGKGKLPTTSGSVEVQVGLIVYDIPKGTSGSELSAGYTIE